ncbi:MAG: DUF3299 domain-containing protein [Cyclonatronaceae bacterium]
MFFSFRPGRAPHNPAGAILLVCTMLLLPAAFPVLASANAPENDPSALAETRRILAAAERVYFSDLRRYPIDRPDAEVPQNITALEGKEVAIVGYMVPFDRIEDITQFILLQAPFMGCMHVPPPGPHETLMIKTETPMASYTQDAIRITGQMSIEEVYVDGYLISVYTINASDISSASDADAELDDLPDNFHMY